jgi:hypothetical protein
MKSASNYFGINYKDFKSFFCCPSDRAGYHRIVSEYGIYLGTMHSQNVLPRKAANMTPSPNVGHQFTGHPTLSATFWMWPSRTFATTATLSRGYRIYDFAYRFFMHLVLLLHHRSAPDLVKRLYTPRFLLRCTPSP